MILSSIALEIRMVRLKFKRIDESCLLDELTYAVAVNHVSNAVPLKNPRLSGIEMKALAGYKIWFDKRMKFEYR